MIFRKKESHGIQGMTFGVMDGVITVLGVMVGLGAIGNRLAVIIGILVTGLADSFANAAGFHVSEETEGFHSRKEVLMSTALAFFATFFVTLILLTPILFLDLINAVYVSVSIGILILVGLGMLVSRLRNNSKIKTLGLIVEYVLIGVLVVAISYTVGSFGFALLEG